jgi:hypothetical protein
LYVTRRALRAYLVAPRPGRRGSQESFVKSNICIAVGVALAALACSNREVPSSFPSSSAASLSATEAPQADVARSLREDPPLPGASTEGWAGLAEHGTAAPGAHDHAGSPAQASAAFSCPMHPEVSSNEPGTCPKCGMKLEPKKP